MDWKNYQTKINNFMGQLSVDSIQKVQKPPNVGNSEVILSSLLKVAIREIQECYNTSAAEPDDILNAQIKQAEEALNSCWLSVLEGFEHIDEFKKRVSIWEEFHLRWVSR